MVVLVVAQARPGPGEQRLTKCNTGLQRRFALSGQGLDRQASARQDGIGSMMSKSRIKRVGFWLLIAGLLSVVTATARDNVPENPNRFQDRFNALNKPAVDVPNVMNRSHKVGNVWMTITIYTLDGDMVRELNHPDPALSDTDSHLVWDLLSRNTQAIVSGIYLFTVESEIGTQVGKLVIIK